MKTTCCYLPETTVDAVDKIAHLTGRSRSNVIRRLIENALREGEFLTAAPAPLAETRRAQ